MKAMTISRFGGPEVFEPMDLPQPEVPAGHVLIKVSGSSVNPIDIKIRSGAVAALAPEFPAVLHGDVCGVIEAMGPGVKRFQVGEAVYGFAGGFKGCGGALAEYMVADANLLARKPAKLPMLDAATLPIVGLTAWEALVERAGIRPGQRVLVHGGTGGVGNIGVQLAKIAGATVYTTVSNDHKAGLARQLGADFAINYREQKVADYVNQHTQGEGFDVVFDTVGGDCLAQSFQAVKTSGSVATIAARSTQDLSPLHARGATLHVVFTCLPLLHGRNRERLGNILTTLAQLIDKGRLMPLLDPEVFTFRNVGAAHQKLSDNRALGKIRLAAEF